MPYGPWGAINYLKNVVFWGLTVHSRTNNFGAIHLTIFWIFSSISGITMNQHGKSNLFIYFLGKTIWLGSISLGFHHNFVQTFIIWLRNDKYASRLLQVRLTLLLFSSFIWELMYGINYLRFDLNCDMLVLVLMSVGLKYGWLTLVFILI